MSSDPQVCRLLFVHRDAALADRIRGLLGCAVGPSLDEQLRSARQGPRINGRHRRERLGHGQEVRLARGRRSVTRELGATVGIIQELT